MFTPVTLQAARSRRMGQANPVMRFEVTDEFGEKFLPGATVEIWVGDILLLSKLADGGGNVSITEREAREAARAWDLSPSYSLMTYSVSYPGYISQQAVIFDRDTDEWQIDRLVNVALVQESLLTNPYVKAVLTTGSFLLSSWFWSQGPGR